MVSTENTIRPRRGRTAALRVFAALAMVGLGAGASAQELTAQETRLRDAIVQRYEVVPLSHGVGLLPKRGGPRLIEVAGDTIALDGVVVSGRELRERLGAEADLVLRLSYLDPERRRQLFGFEAGSTAEPPSAGPPAAPPAPAVRRTPRSRRGGDRVRVLGSVEVGPDEEVRGDVVAVLGSARVDGHVGGEVVAVLGSVELGPNAHVEGDVTSVGGQVRRAPGARVDGAINEIAFSPRVELRPPWWIGWMPWVFGTWDSVARVGRLLGTLVRFVLLLLLGMLVVLVAHDPVQRAAARVRAEPLKAGFVGFLAELLVLPVLIVTVVVLVISIVGIPLLLLVPFALVALLVLLLFGFTATASGVGRAVAERFGWERRRPYREFATGLLLVFTPLLIARAFGLAGGPFSVFAVALAVVGLVVEYAAWTAGFGAALLGVFSRGPVRFPAPPSSPPPEWSSPAAPSPAEERG